MLPSWYRRQNDIGIREPTTYQKRYIACICGWTSAQQDSSYHHRGVGCLAKNEARGIMDGVTRAHDQDQRLGTSCHAAFNSKQLAVRNICVVTFGLDYLLWG